MASDALFSLPSLNISPYKIGLFLCRQITQCFFSIKSKCILIHYRLIKVADYLTMVECKHASIKDGHDFMTDILDSVEMSSNNPNSTEEDKQ